MSEQHLNIISFDIPWPADYGGVIDVYYKLVWLKKAGIKIHLHCFEYGRKHSMELNKLCDSVHYYPRKNPIRSNFSTLPYIVNSRKSEGLEKNLLSNHYPILFEGLHTCYLISDKRFKGRKLIYRESNIEHRYYRNLAKDESSLGKKLFYQIEACRLEMYEKVIANSTMALVVSERDASELSSRYPALDVIYLPSFHAEEHIIVDQPKENYVLFHGNLGVPENSAAALYLLRNVFDKPVCRLIIAGKNPGAELREAIIKNKQAELVADPDHVMMIRLVSKARVNLLYTTRAAGLKLKLLNVLYNGGICVLNQEMVEGTGINLENATSMHCFIENDAAVMRSRLVNIMDQVAAPLDMSARKKFLEERFSNRLNASKLVEAVFC